MEHREPLDEVRQLVIEVATLGMRIAETIGSVTEIRSQGLKVGEATHDLGDVALPFGHILTDLDNTVTGIDGLLDHALDLMREMLEAVSAARPK